MAATYWQKQTPEQPLFPDLLWSRPENRAHAGKLLIIGGNLHGFSVAAEAYRAANQAGVGTARVLLPDALQKTVGKMFEAGEFAPSTLSGSFSQKALDTMLDAAHWSDGVLLAGDLGRNSETAIVIEKFLSKYSGQATISKDTVEYIVLSPQLIQNRTATTLVLSTAQLQHLLVSMRYPKHVSLAMPLLQIIEVLHELTKQFGFNIITKLHDNIIVAVQGQVSSTKASESDLWQTAAAAHSAVWWLQNPTKPFEAMTTAQLNTK